MRGHHYCRASLFLLHAAPYIGGSHTTTHDSLFIQYPCRRSAYFHHNVEHRLCGSSGGDDAATISFGLIGSDERHAFSPISSAPSQDAPGFIVELTGNDSKVYRLWATSPYSICSRWPR